MPLPTFYVKYIFPRLETPAISSKSSTAYTEQNCLWIMDRTLHISVCARMLSDLPRLISDKEFADALVKLAFLPNRYFMSLNSNNELCVYDTDRCGTLKRIVWYFEDGCVVLWRGWSGTLKRVVWWIVCIWHRSMWHHFYHLWLVLKVIKVNLPFYFSIKLS